MAEIHLQINANSTSTKASYVYHADFTELEKAMHALNRELKLFKADALPHEHFRAILDIYGE